MTIKDIAQIAGVSVSTVSKIVNGKDKNINQGTREHVLKIVKEYHYSPYASVKNRSAAKTFLLGVLINGIGRYGKLVDGIMEEARKNGYDIVLCDSGGSQEEELKKISMFYKNRLDGILLDPVPGEGKDLERHIKDLDNKVLIIREPQKGQLTELSYEDMGFMLTLKLLDYGHSRLACVTAAGDEDGTAFYEGFQKCLYQNRDLVSEQLKLEKGNDIHLSELLIREITAVACPNAFWAEEIYSRMSEKNFDVPADFSLLSLRNEEKEKWLLPRIANYEIPFRKYGEFCCRKLIRMIEQKESGERFVPQFLLENENYMDAPHTGRKKKIVVVGSINADIFLNVEEGPQLGKVTVVNNCNLLPGGKGINQATGVARLGGDAGLIGRIGKDVEGMMIYEFLKKNDVNVRGVHSDENTKTGRAYIHVDMAGESGISIFAGANKNLSRQDVTENKSLFRGAVFCLLQTEIPAEPIHCAIELAKENGAKIILKPSGIKTISNSIVSRTDYFVPNRKEMKLLCPHEGTYEEQAGYFLDKGAGTVIITLGHEGCYVRNKRMSEYFPAADFSPADTTGGADAFISALAVYLMNGSNLRTAIRYANCAAGFAVSREGVAPSMADKNTLDCYVDKQFSNTL